MNKRYSDSLVNDPNLRITISLTGVVIFNQISDTPWTNTTSLGAPNMPFNKNKYTLKCNSAVAQFASSMSNLNLTFDHAVAIVKYIFTLIFNFISVLYIILISSKDLWHEANNFGVTGCNLEKIGIGGICNNQTTYSIVEVNGFNVINNIIYHILTFIFFKQLGNRKCCS
jgi:hypothetical protein